MPEMYVGSATVFALVRFESIFGVMDCHDHKHRDDHYSEEQLKFARTGSRRRAGRFVKRPRA
jgi:hypothetical protein